MEELAGWRPARLLQLLSPYAETTQSLGQLSHHQAAKLVEMVEMVLLPSFSL